MFLGYIHTFRALAIFFIVAGHSIDAFNWNGDHDLERVLRLFFSNGSVLFVFIAGYLFQHLSARYQVQKFLSTKFSNVIIPYLFISIPAIVIFTFFQNREGIDPSFLQQPAWFKIFYFYATGVHLAPLWFIPMIAIFYLISPALIRADKMKYFYYSIPFLILLSCFVQRGSGNPLQSFTHFFSVYVSGMFFSHYKLTINPKLQSNMYLGIFIFGFFGFFSAEYFLTKETMTFLNLLQKLSIAMVFLGTLIRLKGKYSHRFIDLIAETSFGIFFIHSYVVTGLKMSFLKLTGSQAEGNIIAYFFLIIVILGISTGIIYAAKQILGSKSKYFVGS